MTDGKKTDVLNLRLDPALAMEIDRIAAWRGKTASEAARELLQYGVRVERDLEADELKRGYDLPRVDRSAINVRVEVNGKLAFLSFQELAEMQAEREEERAAASQVDDWQ